MPTNQPTEQAPEGKDLSLKRRAIHGSFWTLAGYGTSQVLRLASNLVLTRLLAPEAFGLMALVYTFLAGLQMFSDFGVFPSVVQSKRGEDIRFLNTAWTIQVIRGGVLWLGSCLIALPVAQFYKEPMLAYFLPIAGLSALIGGAASTKLATANRRLALRQLTLLDLLTNVITLVGTVIAVWVYRSVWVLVISSVLGSLLKTIASHIWLEGARNSFAWDQEAVEEIRQFGRWIFLSTIFGFFALQSDRLILGKLLDIRFLGVYTIALALSSTVEQVVEQINSKVLFPSYSELVRDRPEDLHRSLYKARLILVSLSSVFVVFLVFGGEWLVDVLYDDRYLEAGWILRVLAVGFLGRVLSITYGDVLLARGDTFITMTLTITGTCILFAAMLLGYSWGGYQGVIVGIALTDWLVYGAYAICFMRLSLWQPTLDLPIMGFAAGLSAVVYHTGAN